MKNGNGNESAYPVDATGGFSVKYGLTKRELFAINAMQGLLVNAGRNGLSMTECADAAVIQADLLLTALEVAK